MTDDGAAQGHLEAVLALARRCAAEPDPDRVLRILLEGAVALVGGDDGGIARWEEARGVLFQVESYLPSTSRGVPLDMERSASGRAALLRAPVVVNDYQREVGPLTPAGKIGAQAGLAAPLLQEGRLLGTLSVSSFDPAKRFTKADAAALELLAGIGASVLVGQERARLDALARARQEVLAMVSHDLRNPITAVSTQLQLIRRHLGRMRRPPQGIATGVERAERSLAKMLSLVDELRDVALLEGERPLALEGGPVDLVALARDAVAEQAESARRHTLRVEATEPALVGHWDGPRLQRVLDNLLTNALKYSPNGGEVVVGVRREGDEAVLTVRDQGIGIPPSELGRVFDRFYRGANAAGRVVGAGIGLFGARRIVDQHGGTIEVESREGVGSTFTVRLPLEAP